jgi:hypothetical protein
MVANPCVAERVGVRHFPLVQLAPDDLCSTELNDRQLTFGSSDAAQIASRLGEGASAPKRLGRPIEVKALARGWLERLAERAAQHRLTELEVGVQLGRVVACPLSLGSGTPGQLQRLPLVKSYVVGHVLWILGDALIGQGQDVPIQEPHFAEQYPQLAAYLPYIGECDEEDEFERGLDVLIAGLHALRGS